MLFLSLIHIQMCIRDRVSIVSVLVKYMLNHVTKMCSLEIIDPLKRRQDFFPFICRSQNLITEVIMTYNGSLPPTYRPIATCSCLSQVSLDVGAKQCVSCECKIQWPVFNSKLFLNIANCISVILYTLANVIIFCDGECNRQLGELL